MGLATDLLNGMLEEATRVVDVEGRFPILGVEITITSRAARLYVSFMEDITLRGLCKESAEIAKSKGFSGQTVPEFLSLVHSELSEALEEHRGGREPDETYYTVGSAALKMAAREALGLSADQLLPKCVNTRLPCEQGALGAKPEGIPSELADVIIRCCHFAGENGIDLVAAIREKVEFNRTRPFKHGGKTL